ncbi:hypothetical protein EMMF5_005591 [Cystobasidiomycetes sp. EMM_F5]
MPEQEQQTAVPTSPRGLVGTASVRRGHSRRPSAHATGRTPTIPDTKSFGSPSSPFRAGLNAVNLSQKDSPYASIALFGNSPKLSSTSTSTEMAPASPARTPRRLSESSVAPEDGMQALFGTSQKVSQASPSGSSVRSAFQPSRSRSDSVISTLSSANAPALTPLVPRSRTSSFASLSSLSLDESVPHDKLDQQMKRLEELMRHLNDRSSPLDVGDVRQKLADAIADIKREVQYRNVATPSTMSRSSMQTPLSAYAEANSTNLHFNDEPLFAAQPYSTLLKRGPSIGQTQTPGSVSLLTSPAVSDISTTSSAKLRSASQSLAEAKAERDAIKNAIKSKDEKRRMNKAESANARAIAMQVWKVEEERKQVERDQRLLLEKLEYEKMAEQHTQSVAERQRDFGQQVQRQAAEMRASHEAKVKEALAQVQATRSPAPSQATPVLASASPIHATPLQAPHGSSAVAHSSPIATAKTTKATPSGSPLHQASPMPSQSMRNEERQQVHLYLQHLSRGGPRMAGYDHLLHKYQQEHPESSLAQTLDGIRHAEQLQAQMAAETEARALAAERNKAKTPMTADLFSPPLGTPGPSCVIISE